MEYSIMEPFDDGCEAIWCNVCSLVLTRENCPHYSIHKESTPMIPNFCPRCGAADSWNKHYPKE